MEIIRVKREKARLGKMREAGNLTLCQQNIGEATKAFRSREISGHVIKEQVIQGAQ